MSDHLLAYVINAAWQIPLIVAAGLALTRIARPAAAECCSMLTILLFVAALLPALSLRPVLDSLSLVPSPRLSVAQNAVPLLPPFSPAPVIQRTPGHIELAPWAADLIIAALLLAMVIRAAQLLVAMTAARLCVQRAKLAVLPPDVLIHVRRFAERADIPPPAILVSSGVAGPAVAGAIKPVILVPESFGDLTPEAMRAALLHECAHIMREDYAGNWLCELMALPLCWHPALYMLKREHRMAREIACDELASAWMASPSRYAAGLLEIARTSVKRRSLAAAQLMIGRGDLERRIRRLVRPTPRSQAAKARDVSITAALLLSMALPAALLRVTPAVAGQSRLEGAAPQPTSNSAPGPAARTETGSPINTGKPVARRMRRVRPYAVSSEVEETTVINAGRVGYTHSWVSPSGRRYSIVNDTPRDPTAEEKRRLEPLLDEAQVQAAKVRRLMQGPQFRETMQRLSDPAFKAQVAKAEALANDPQVQRALAQAKTVLASGELRRELEQAIQSLDAGDADRTSVPVTGAHTRTDTHTDTRTDVHTDTDTRTHS